MNKGRLTSTRLSIMQAQSVFDDIPSCASSRQVCSVLMARRYNCGLTISSAVFLCINEMCAFTRTATAASKAGLWPNLAGTSRTNGPRTDIRTPTLPVVVAAIKARASSWCCEGDGCLRKGDFGGDRLLVTDLCCHRFWTGFFS